VQAEGAAFELQLDRPELHTHSTSLPSPQPASQPAIQASQPSQLINQQIAPHLPFVAAIVHPDVNGLFFFFSVCFCFARHRSIAT
jgi:hypothetical protein